MIFEDKHEIKYDCLHNGAVARIKKTERRPYAEWCRKPEACAGKGYCPLDPSCGD